MSSAMGSLPGDRRRPWVRGLGVLLVLLLVVVVAVGVYFFVKVRNGLEGEVARRPMMPSATSVQTPGVGTPPRVRPLRPASAGDAQNLLLIRNDAPDGRTPQLGSLAVVHIGDAKDRVDILTLPVDAPAPAHGGAAPYSKLYAGGGAPVLVSAVEDTTAVPIDNVAELDADGFEAMKTLLQPSSLADPFALNEVLNRAMQGLVLDENFDRKRMQALAFTMFENGVRPQTHNVAAPLVDGTVGADGAVPVPPHIDRLRAALIHDDPTRLGS